MQPLLEDSVLNEEPKPRRRVKVQSSFSVSEGGPPKKRGIRRGQTMIGGITHGNISLLSNYLNRKNIIVPKGLVQSKNRYALYAKGIIGGRGHNPAS